VSDAEAVARLHADSRDEAYAELVPAQVLSRRRADILDWIERWERQLSAPGARTFVAENETGLVGFATVTPARDDSTNGEELRALYVRAAWWGRGLGHALITAGLGQGPASLWVLVGNDRAIDFYRSHGFVEDGSTQECDLGIELRMVR
jgi:GNAT superfamily N-acetyltransferase